jgi:hypothetical protein
MRHRPDTYYAIISKVDVDTAEKLTNEKNAGTRVCTESLRHSQDGCCWMWSR